jgi:hypothetical protein
MITYISNEERRNMKHDMVRTYSRKAKHLEAVQLTKDNLYEVASWCGGKVVETQGDQRDTSDVYIQLIVPNVDGNDTATLGTFITRDLSDGRFYVKGANFFLEEYDLPAEVRVEEVYEGTNRAVQNYLGIPGAVPVTANGIKEVPADFDPATEPLTPHYVPRMGRYDRG